MRHWIVLALSVVISPAVAFVSPVFTWPNKNVNSETSVLVSDLPNEDARVPPELPALAELFKLRGSREVSAPPHVSPKSRLANNRKRNLVQLKRRQAYNMWRKGKRSELPTRFDDQDQEQNLPMKEASIMEEDPQKRTSYSYWRKGKRNLGEGENFETYENGNEVEKRGGRTSSYSAWRKGKRGRVNNYMGWRKGKRDELWEKIVEMAGPMMREERSVMDKNYNYWRKG